MSEDGNGNPNRLAVFLTPESLTSTMPDPTAAPDDFFLAEFGSGELSSRLWRGGLRADNEGYTLGNSPHYLSTRLKDGLDARVSDNSVTAIIDDIETCWNDPARMRRACGPLLGNGSNTSTLSVSFVKLVLSIDVFQPAMMKCIINKISELGEESCPDKDVAVMLLNQLRWLDFIADGSALCDNLFSIVPIVSSPMQKALIEALPEILDDSSRESAVTELVRILEESPSMMGSVVDALGALGVDDSRLPDVNTSILSTLAAVNRDVLPVSLKYLIRTCPPALLVETVTAIRHTLALPSLGAGPGRMCLDAVKSGLRMSKLVADHVVKTLRKFEQPSEHKPADLWLLLALFGSPMHRKPAEVVFRKKAANGVFSRTFLDAALAPFASSFNGLTDRLIEMASIAAKASEIGARRTGVFLYALLFRIFDSGNARRNVISSVLNHTGTRKPAEIDAGLEALALIAKEGEDDRSLMPHSASVLGLLDFLEFFTDPQLRQIWTVLGYLCRASVSSGSSNNGAGSSRRRSVESVQDLDLEDDENAGAELSVLQILLRKELTHSETFYRRIGVIGACTMVKVLGNRVKNTILSMLLEVGKSHPYNQALAFDELAHVFCEGDPATIDTAESIRKTVSGFFERKYISDKAGLGAFVKDESLLPASYFGNLEGEDTDFCFSISSLVRNEATLKESQDAIRAMVPSLRLLCVMTSTRFAGSLTEVDAIIGAPLHMPIFPADKDMDELNTRAKGDLLLSLFVAHGWIVELINAFAEQSDAELRAKCVRRVDNLLELTAQISSLTSQMPVWSNVLFDSYNGTRLHFRNSSGNDSAITRGRPKKKKLKDAANARSGPRATQDWRKYSRLLNPSALSLVRVTEPISFRLTETEEQAREGAPSFESVCLSPKALQYLLNELFAQVDELVGADLKRDTVLSTFLFRSAGTTASAARQRLLSEASTDGIFRKFFSLRTALTSLGSQLTLCLKKIFPLGNELESDEDEVSLEIYLSCVTLCLHILARCLNASVLSEVLSQDLLFGILSSIRLDGEAPVQPSDPMTTADIHAAAKTAFDQLHKRLGMILPSFSTETESSEGIDGSATLKFEGCVAFFAAMDSIFIHCSEKAAETLGPRFSKAALAVLRISWDVNTLRSKKTQKLIPGIVRIHVQYSRDSITAAEDLKDKLVELAQKQDELDSKPVDTQNPSGQCQDNNLGSLVEQTCYPYTVAVLEQYLWLFKSFQPKSFDRVDDAFARMERLIKAELPLYNLARKNQRALGPVMRAGRTMVDLFLKICLPFLKETFGEHRSSVIQMCKMHQKPTRALQTFCAHSKSVRDISLTGLVPPLRKSLELLLYRVKDLLQSHNATEAFQLGNLKHRDINGEVLSSQHMQYKSESENESEYNSGEETDGDGDEEEQGVPRRLQSQPNETNRKRHSPLTNGPRKRRKSNEDLNREDHDGTRTTNIRRPQTPLRGSKKQRKRKRGEDTMDGITNSDTTSRRRRKNLVREEEEDRPRNPLIDDEAGEDGDENGSDNDGVDDLSQFLVFDEEEEEEEA